MSQKKWPGTTKDHVSRIKALLFEKGYYVFPLTKYRRRSIHDFVAIPRGHPTNLVVGTVRDGRITVRPFLSSNSEVEKTLSWAREKHLIPVYWNKSQIPLRPRVEIEHLLTPTGLQQLKILIPEMFIKRQDPASEPQPLRGRMRKIEKRNKFGSGRHMWQ